MDVDDTRIPPKDNAEGSREKPGDVAANLGAPLVEPQAREQIASMTQWSNPTAENLLSATNFSLTDNKGFVATVAGEDRRFSVAPGDSSTSEDRTNKEKSSDKIKRDSEGRVTEVALPDGRSRQFGYDDKGNLNRVVQPNGETYVRKDGKWQIDGKPGDAVDFQNPTVSGKGDLSYERRDGARVNQYADGTKYTQAKDGTGTLFDAKDRITFISYANGDKRGFSYDEQGKITSFSENGKHYFVDGLGYVGGTELKDPKVGPDGSFTITNGKGDVKTTFIDGRQTIMGADRSQIHKSADGRITEVAYPDGTTRKFGYDQNGRLNSVTDRDGKQYNLNATFDFFGSRSGDFRAADGTTLGGTSLEPDGTLKYQDKDGKIRTDYTNGNSTTTTRTAAELQQIAAGLHQDNWIFTDNANIKKALDELSPVDRVALDDQYKQLYGQSLSEKLRGQAWNPLKQENTQAALASLSEAHLRAAVTRNFTNPQAAADATKSIDDFNVRAKQYGLSPEQVAAGFDKALKELKSDVSDSKKLEALDRSLSGAAPLLTSLEAKYGVKREEVVQPDGSKVQRYYVQGDRGARLPVLEATGDNPREIEQKLQAWREAKIKELEGKHNLQISRDHQVENLRGNNTTLRAPRIDEVLGLEQSLPKSQPSERSSTGLPLQIKFPVTTTYRGVDAYVPHRQKGVPESIVFEPMERTFEGFKDTARHEFAHIGQRNVAERDPAALAKFAEATGYRQVTTEQGIQQWQLKGKDGHYYTENPTDPYRKTWTRVDEKGRPLKADGTPAKNFADKDAVSLPRAVMREQAAVKPATNYFPNPIENGAEALHLFRGGAANREDLFTTSPEVYRAIKEYDQREIDADPRFGKNADGTSKFIRLPDGTLGENNDVNRKAVSEYEQGLSALTQSRYSPPGNNPNTGEPARDSAQTPPTHQHLPNFTCPNCK